MLIPDTTSPDDLLAIWPDYAPTPLLDAPGLASRAGVEQVRLKLEGHRPHGNFKVLGGMVAGLQAIVRFVGADSISGLISNPAGYRSPPRLMCASDGNHGLAVASAAARAGGPASIYLPSHVSRFRSERIEALGGQVVRVRGTYDDAVEAVKHAARRGEGLLVPDTTDRMDDQAVGDVMAGYGVMTRELRLAFAGDPRGLPTHQFIQAGVGGLAAAMAQGLCSNHPPGPDILVVEPEAAACVAHALRIGRPERIPGDLTTSADMLSCGLASAPALAILQAHQASSIIVSERQLRAATDLVRETVGLETTASGAAGAAGLMAVAADPALRMWHGLTANSRVLLVITEQAPPPTDPVPRHR